MYKLFDFRNRRSVRRFSSRQIESDLLDRLLMDACHAPTTGNMQLYSVIVSSDQQQLRRLAEYHFNQPAAVGAPVILTFCIDFHRFEHWCDVSDARHGYRNLQSFMMGALDTALVAQQFVTAAESEGLGTCYLGTTLYTAPQIADLLQLPDGVVPLISVALGYPEGEMPADAGRLPLHAVVHRSVYRKDSDDDIRRLYAEKENRADSLQFVAENGKSTLAQVFTDVRYPESQLSEFSGYLREYLDRAFYC